MDSSSGLQLRITDYSSGLRITAQGGGYSSESRMITAQDYRLQVRITDYSSGVRITTKDYGLQLRFRGLQLRIADYSSGLRIMIQA